MIDERKQDDLFKVIDVLRCNYQYASKPATVEEASTQFLNTLFIVEDMLKAAKRDFPWHEQVMKEMGLTKGHRVTTQEFIQICQETRRRQELWYHKCFGDGR